MDPGERADDDRSAAHEPRLHRRVLTRRALAVVLVADRDPARCRRALYRLARSGSGTTEPSRTSTPWPELLERERVVRADEEVAGDVREVTAVLQPRPRGRDVVGGALARRLQQHLQPGDSPGRPRPGTARAARAARSRASPRSTTESGSFDGGDEAGLAGVEALARQLVGDRRHELDLGAVGRRPARARSRRRAGR